MPRNRASRGQSLKHIACSNTTRGLDLKVSDFNIVQNRPARPTHVVGEFAASVGSTVQFVVYAADGTALFASPILVVGTNSKRVQYRLPSSEMSNYGAEANVLGIRLGSGGQDVHLAASFALTMLYGDVVKSLC